MTQQEIDKLRMRLLEEEYIRINGHPMQKPEVSFSPIISSEFIINLDNLEYFKNNKKKKAGKNNGKSI